MSRLEEEVEAEAAATDGASPFQRELAAFRQAAHEPLARIDARLAELRAETAKVRGEQQAVADEAARLRPLADALRAGRWWSGAWWRARRDGGLLSRTEERESRQRELKATEERLIHESEEQTAERGRLESRSREEAAAWLRREVERRRAEREERRTALARAMEALEEQGRTASRSLSEGTAPPAELSVAAVREAHDVWRSLLERDERRAAAAALGGSR